MTLSPQSHDALQTFFVVLLLFEKAPFVQEEKQMKDHNGNQSLQKARKTCPSLPLSLSPSPSLSLSLSHSVGLGLAWGWFWVGSRQV